MPSTACAQKLILPIPTVSAAYFDSSFYRPYEAAAHAALQLLSDARAKLEASGPEICVRAMTFRLKSPASIRDKLIKKGLSPTQPCTTSPGCAWCSPMKRQSTAMPGCSAHPLL